MAHITRLHGVGGPTLVRSGAHVLVHYKRSADQAESPAAAITSKGGRARTRKADRSAPDGPTLLARGARAIVGERLDVFVSNAGVSKAAPLSDYVVDDFGAYVPGHLTKRGFVPFAILWPEDAKGRIRNWGCPLLRAHNGS